VTRIRLRDGKVERGGAAADAEGRLRIELDGDAWEVGIGKAALPALAGYRVANGPWATAGRPVTVRARFWNKGGAAAPAAVVKWESHNPGVRFVRTAAALPALASGKSAEAPVEFTVNDGTREIVRLFAVIGKQKLPLDVPLFPSADKAAFKLADGVDATVFQRGINKRELRLGEGDGDGSARPGETVAVLFAEDGAFRAAELFTNDACVDLTRRVSDGWGGYDNVGASAKYTLAAIRPDCPAGHVVRAMARVQLPSKPNHRVRHAVIEIPVGGSRTTK
jgi:hypothetical protein